MDMKWQDKETSFDVLQCSKLKSVIIMPRNGIMRRPGKAVATDGSCGAKHTSYAELADGRKSRSTSYPIYIDISMSTA